MAQLWPAHRRALIVEDETMFAMGLVADMSAVGFDTCDLAANGQDAFLQAMEDPPDIVLMDVNLEGGREGIEAARWLREVCDIPIVFVTGNADPDTVERIHRQVPGAPVLPKLVIVIGSPKPWRRSPCSNTEALLPPYVGGAFVALGLAVARGLKVTRDVGVSGLFSGRPKDRRQSHARRESVRKCRDTRPKDGAKA
jgi:CheY-like chemotaxis protein